MRNQLSVGVVLVLTAVAAASLLGAHVRRASSPIRSPVAALDRCIQERFQTVNGVGMSRMPVVPQHVTHFDPETSSESAAVTDLQRQGLTVGFYLGGRGLLESPPSKAEWDASTKFSGRRAVSEPILITGDEPLARLPEPWELWRIGQRALKGAAESDKYQASFGRWTVDARLVRAHREECLGCHKTALAPGTPEVRSALKVGDALGVVYYVYSAKR